MPPWPQRVIDAAKPALVGIVTIRPTQDGGGATGRVSGVGFIVEPSGYILTSSRAVRGPSAIHVRLADGRTLPVTRIGWDPLRDVAALKVNATGLPTIRLGSSSALTVGEVDRAKPILRRLQARAYPPERHRATTHWVPVGPVGSFERSERGER